MHSERIQDREENNWIWAISLTISISAKWLGLLGACLVISNAVNQKFLTVFSYFYLTFLYSNTMTLQAVKKRRKKTHRCYEYVLVAKNVKEKNRGKVFF